MPLIRTVTALIGLAIVSAGVPSPVSAQAPEIRIGLLYPTSGNARGAAPGSRAPKPLAAMAGI